MKDKSTVNKIQGCLLGGAAGDALGYAVEFLQEETIFEKYGPNGITEYDTGVFEKALISDDTQMSLFTAAGLLLAQDRMVPFEKSDAFVQCISDAYSDWLMTQTEEYVSNKDGINTWLATIPEMYNWRSPGGSCLSGAAAGRRGVPGRIESPLNFSKGCGGVMRVAPIGLFFDSAKVSLADMDMLGARAAVLTHGHPLGYIPASAMVHIVHCVTHEDMELCDAVESALVLIPYLFPKSQYMEEFLSIMRKAIQLATYEIDDLDAIHELGAGRYGEDNLAIAIYCALKHSDDFESAIVAAVNHSGDSDSTGAVTGNIMGAYLGMDAIPEKYLEKLELRDVIIQIADELSMGYSLDLYTRYKDMGERLYLLRIAQKYGLLISAGSDFHAQEAWESLDHRTSCSACSDLLEHLGIKVNYPLQPADLYVMSGYSGVGKGTIAEIIKARQIDGKPVALIQSYTNRAPRSENDPYTFVTREEFTAMAKAHKFLEFNDAYAKNGYGTPVAAVREAIERDLAVLLEIDRVGLLHLMTDGKVNPNLIHSAFIVADAAAVETRLRLRGTEPMEKIRSRLETAKEESYHLDLYDAVIENLVVDDAVHAVIAAFEGNPPANNFDAVKFRADMDQILTTY